MEPKNFYDLGKRDAVANLFMWIREKGERATLHKLAEQLITLDGYSPNPNPHAKWYLENHKEAS